jgi:hypothetical protein
VRAGRYWRLHDASFGLTAATRAFSRSTSRPARSGAAAPNRSMPSSPSHCEGTSLDARIDFSRRPDQNYSAGNKLFGALQQCRIGVGWSRPEMHRLALMVFFTWGPIWMGSGHCEPTPGPVCERPHARLVNSRIINYEKIASRSGRRLRRVPRPVG